VPTTRARVLEQAWPYALAAVEGPCLPRLARALDALAPDLGHLPPEVPVLVGSSSLLIADTEEAWASRPPLHPVDALERAVRGHWGLSGPGWTFSCACISSATALDAGATLVGTGLAEEVLVLGVELFNRTTLAGFAAMGLLAPEACRPLDAHRQGLVLGEAVAAVRLCARPGPWRIHPPALALDPTSPTGPREDGGSLARIMGQALDQANLAPADLEAVKLQAAGSPATDAAEARALRLHFGASLPPVFSIKACLGHALGACSLAELAAVLACAEDGWLPGTAGFRTEDPALGLSPRPAPAPYRGGPILFNIQGFGGCLASWVAERA
jgi:3-oxoacyl-[acyl-carrier-protein] synthase-1